MSSSEPTGTDRPIIHRRTVRVLIADADSAILLFLDSDLGLDPVAHWWNTPGGGVEDGERDTETAIREVLEETGLVITAADLVGPIAVRVVRHGYSDVVTIQEETFFVVRTPRFAVDTSRHTEGELACIVETRWCLPPDFRTVDGVLTLDGYAVWPAALHDLLALADEPSRWIDRPVDLGEIEESSVPLTS